MLTQDFLFNPLFLRLCRRCTKSGQKIKKVQTHCFAKLSYLQLDNYVKIKKWKLCVNPVYLSKTTLSGLKAAKFGMPFNLYVNSY